MALEPVWNRFVVPTLLRELRALWGKERREGTRHDATYELQTA